MKPVLIAPPYTGPNATCPTCGHVGASTEHEESEGITSLARTCGRCGRTWTERPVTPTATFGFASKEGQ